MKGFIVVVSLVWTFQACADSRVASCRFYDDKEGDWVTTDIPVSRVLEFASPESLRHDKANSTMDNLSEKYKNPAAANEPSFNSK